MLPLVVPITMQLAWLFTLAIPVACVAWTVTHEEVLREPREFCARRSQSADSIVERKFFYLFTCEYCFSHYVALAALWLTHFRLLVDGWGGYMLAWFAVVWIANQYISIHSRLRVSIKAESTEIAIMEDQRRDGDSHDGPAAGPATSELQRPRAVSRS